MATSTNAGLIIEARAKVTPSSPLSEGPSANLASSARWTAGTGSGQVDRAYMVSGTLAAAASDAYNTLAAGSLTDPLGQAIDLDELKGLVLYCATGAIKLVGGASTPAGFVTAAAEGIKLAAGQRVAFDFGAAGLNVAANSLFTITDTAGGSGSTYTLWFVGAQ